MSDKREASGSCLCGKAQKSTKAMSIHAGACPLWHVQKVDGRAIIGC